MFADEEGENTTLLGEERTADASEEETATEEVESTSEQPNDTQAKPSESSDNPSNSDQTESEQEGTEGADLEYDFSDVWNGAEYDEQMASHFADEFRKINLNKEQANAVMKMGVAWSKSIEEGLEQARQEEFARKEQETRKALGKDLDSRLTMASSGIQVIEKIIPTFRQWLDETGLGNDLTMVQICEQLGKLVSEDNGKLGKGVSVSSEDDMLKKRWKNSPNMFR